MFCKSSVTKCDINFWELLLKLLGILMYTKAQICTGNMRFLKKVTLPVEGYILYFDPFLGGSLKFSETAFMTLWHAFMNMLKLLTNNVDLYFTFDTL